MKTRNLKLVIVGLFLVLVMGICGCGTSDAYNFSIEASPKFRNCQLGHSRTKVIESEPFLISYENTMGNYSILYYWDVLVDGFDAMIVYYIDRSNDTLASGAVYYYVEDDKVDEVYDALVKKSDNICGETHLYDETDSIVWRTDDGYVIIRKSTASSPKCIIYTICTFEYMDNI